MYQAMLMVHLLAATVWVGGHLVLAVTILPEAMKQKDVVFIRRFESAYERIGIPALLIQVVSGVWMVLNVIPDIGYLWQSEWPLVRLLWCKLGLLLITMGLAADARLRIIPNLTQDSLSSLAWHIVPVTVVAVLFAVVGMGYRFGWV